MESSSYSSGWFALSATLNNMIRGATRSFPCGARCTIVAHEHEHCGALVTVLALSDHNGRRWVGQLLSGETTPFADDELQFESYHAAAVALQTDGSDWLQAAIADPGHLNCTPSLRVAASAAGEGLGVYAPSCIKAKAVALSEPIMMLARRSGIATTGLACWAVYSAALKAANTSVATAFDALADGGLIERHRDDARRIFEHEARASLPPEYYNVLLQDAEICEREVHRIAECLARWQANGHEFVLRGEHEACVAVYNLAMRLQHSCEPNCEQRISGQGDFVVSTLRPIEAGEMLTIDYTQAERCCNFQPQSGASCFGGCADSSARAAVASARRWSRTSCSGACRQLSSA